MKGAFLARASSLPLSLWNTHGPSLASSPVIPSFGNNPLENFCPLKVFFPQNIPHPVTAEQHHQAPGEECLLGLQVIFADIFFEFIFGPSFAVCPICNVQCFWLGPNSEFLTNWMNEFLVDQNYHLSRE